LKPDGSILDVSRSALQASGLEMAQVLGKRMDETAPWTYSPEVQKMARDAIKRAADGEASRFDVAVLIGDRQIVHLDFSLQPVRNDAGEVVLLVPSAQNSTERKRAENHVRQLNRVYLVLSDINQMIVREKDPQAILDGTCR